MCLLEIRWPPPPFFPCLQSGPKSLLALQSEFSDVCWCVLPKRMQPLKLPGRAGGLYSHTAAKVVFIRYFRNTRHVYKHTLVGWIAWTSLCLAAVAIAYVFAISVPIFSYLIGIAASLFASWYTYGIAGFFWIHDAYHLKGGWASFRKQPAQAALAVFTVVAGAFICVAGTFVSIKESAGPTTVSYVLNPPAQLIDDAYKSNLINATQILFLLPLAILPFAWSSRLYSAGVRYTKSSFCCLLILMNQWFAPTKLIITFERDGTGRFTDEEIERIVVKDDSGNVVALDLPNRFILIANHQVYADWLYAWTLTYYIGNHGIHDSVYIALKKSLQWLPILGWAMRFYNFIFLARSWVYDRVQLSTHLAALGKIAEREQRPFVFFLYPEGTVVSPNTRPISKKFADKMGIDDMSNVLLPRSTGLHFTLRALAPRIPDLKLLDITTVYPGIPPLGYGQQYYTLRSIFFHGVPPPAIHFHLRLFDVATEVPVGDLARTVSSPGATPKSSAEVDIPETEKAVFDAWLRALWKEKDLSITRWFDKASFAQSSFAIPLRLRRKREIFDAVGFFPVAVLAHLAERLIDPLFPPCNAARWSSIFFTMNLEIVNLKPEVSQLRIFGGNNSEPFNAIGPGKV
ncbi:unnamed protein product [Mycena citricolor]|uniref:Phospholipid/glycerol acyltransferase domain-containing protein n=1 Tax=Mycena citricolor TaxID=2018698 RepID=A0AAD2HS51_9AGAR|nr:unnamed protein product [Mycena citricolor]